MSRTVKRPYTGSKRFSTQCRCHGGCPYCENGRLRYKRIGEDLTDIAMQEVEDAVESILNTSGETLQKPQTGSPRRVDIDLTKAFKKIKTRLKQSP